HLPSPFHHLKMRGDGAPKNVHHHTPHTPLVVVVVVLPRLAARRPPPPPPLFGRGGGGWVWRPPPVSGGGGPPPRPPSSLLIVVPRAGFDQRTFHGVAILLFFDHEHAVLKPDLEDFLDLLFVGFLVEVEVEHVGDGVSDPIRALRVFAIVACADDGTNAVDV